MKAALKLLSRRWNVSVAALSLLILSSCSDAPRTAQRSLTFNRDIAPMIHSECSVCHRPGQSAPFSLLSYEDVQDRAKQIVAVTRSRYMPPWLPAPGGAQFIGERSLTATQIQMIADWVEQGAVQGDPADLPPTPAWADGWHLGPPDLVVEMDESFILGESGPDVYHNFVIPIPIQEAKYVRAVELRPGNPTVVHHAFLRFDATPESRLLDEKDDTPGFRGFHPPSTAKPPQGHFLSYQPGRLPSESPEGLPWVLEPATDLVLLMHLQPSGKPEPVRPSVGFYFTDEAPSNMPFKIWLTSFSIDIPAGAANHVVEDDYELPVDADILGILPHAHYLGRSVEAFAGLPNGQRVELLRIPEWDFDWQSDYRYKTPIHLPKGARIGMRWVYDNSTNNIANPNDPPERVSYGLESADEMAEVWVQVLPKSSEDRETLSQHYQYRAAEQSIAYNEFLLRDNPNDAQAHSGIGKILYLLGRHDEAMERIRAAMRLDPALDEPHYFHGLILRQQGETSPAIEAFQEAIARNPSSFKAYGNLGVLLVEQQRVEEAEAAFEKALELNPTDAVAKRMLERIRQAAP